MKSQTQALRNSSKKQKVFGKNKRLINQKRLMFS